ncbi:MAG: flavodoxin family protein [Methanomassiliicoccales archaeon]|jgi:multimeric flavodoxin WrbA|nr:flavodoxin family protein [Methanomassiliicoccales archaeon]
MKVLALNGSPRKEGNTARILRKSVEEHEDVDLRYHDLVDLKIRDCISCRHCKTHDSCSIRDDMTIIYQDMRWADAIVLASPIYMSAETALLKAVVDRTYALVASAEGGPGKYRPRLAPGKRGVALFTCGNPKGDETLVCVRDRYYQHFAFLGVAQAKSIIVPGLSPGMDAMETVKAQAAVEEIKAFLRG